MRRAVLSLAALAALGLAAPQAGALIDPGTGTSYETAVITVPMVFPVARPTGFSDTFLACRSGCARKHMGQDLMGPKMTPLLATFDGVVTVLNRDSGSGNTIGITADRGPAAGWTSLYLHVNNDTPGTDDGRGSAQWAFPAGLERGSRVVAGQLVGWLGDSGNAESTGAHLHYELRKGSGWGGVVYNAYSSLVRARRLSAPLPSGPHPEGTVAKHPNGALFLVDDGGKRPVTPEVLATHGRALATAVSITAAESLGYRTLPPVLARDGSVVRDATGTTWLVHDGTRSQAGTTELTALSVPARTVHPLSDADLARLPEAVLPTTAVFAGALVRVDGDPQVHLVEQGSRLRPLSGPVMASHGWSSRDVVVLPAPPVEEPPVEVGVVEAAWRTLEQAEVGEPLPIRDGTVVQTPSRKVAVVSGGFARRLWDARMVAAYGYTGKPRLAVSDAVLAALPTRALTG